MRKNLLVLFVLFCCLTGYSQGVVVSTTANGNANPTQLVNYLLGNSACLVQPTGAVKSTGLSSVSYAQGNSIGTFTNSNAAFPMASGVVLVTGDAATASGPNTSVSSDNSVQSQTWLGDADLQAAFAATTPIRSMNATVLEFDFVAATPNISIPYIFASEEYGQYQCNSKDGFAILIKVAGSPAAYRNIATVPGTNLPVSVANIRNSAFNSGTATCLSVNSQYFGVFNGGSAAPTAATNFEGQTVQLTASANDLVPGTTYHIKIVIADDGDANPNNTLGNDGRYNSAVFFPQGAFNIGQQVVGDNLSLANNTALCQGSSYTVNTGLTGSQYTFAWTRVGNAAVIGTASSLTVNATGTYNVRITNTTTACAVDEQVTIEFAPQLVPGAASTLYACPSGGSYTYNLALNTPSLKTGLDAATQVTYHTTAQAANDGTGAVNAAAYTTTGGTVTIYARVKSHNSSCYVVVPFDLMTIPTPTATQPAAGLSACEGTINTGTAIFNLTAQDAAILGSQAPADYTVTYYTTLADANAGTGNIVAAGNYQSATTNTVRTQTIYARVQSSRNISCYAVTSFTITVNLLPAVSTGTTQTVCGSYTLPVITDGNYYTGSGGTGALLSANSQIISTQTIYIYSVNANCSNQSSFTITVLPGAVTPAPVTACNSYTLPNLDPGQEYRTAANGAGTVIPWGTVISTTSTIYFYIPTAASCTNTSSFVVTIVKADDPADVAQCTSYQLPALTAGNTYWTAPGGPTGGGTQLAVNAQITTTQTIYVYKPHPDGSCFNENSFNVTIITVDPVPNYGVLRRCTGYLVPSIPNANIYTGPGGTGTLQPVGSIITTSQTLYVYSVSPANASCFSESSFQLIINPSPAISTFSNVSACGSYTLPADPTIEGYYEGPNATGNFHAVNTVISSTISLYATTASTVEGCRTYRQFTITILGTTAANPGSRSVCESYTLPALATGSRYFTLAGGPGTTGNVQKFAGDVITTTTTLYVYASSTGSTPPCTAESSFVITVVPRPSVGNFAGVIVCGSYVLPTLTTGNYYSSTGGVGLIAPGTTITTSQTIYVYAANPSLQGCADEKTLSVRIIDGNNFAPADPAPTCGSYTLPALPNGVYYTGPNGTGSVVPVGTAITTTTRIYTYANINTGANCTGNESILVTITTTPTVQTLPPVNACNSYTLQPLSAGNYYTGPAGTGTMYPGAGGTVLTTSQLPLYVYNSNPGCAAESQFNITINRVQITNVPANQTVCSDTGYPLPPYPVAGSAYYTMAGGPTTPGNVQKFPGDIITTNATVYIYAQISGTTCTDEKSFTVTTVAPPVINVPPVVASCTSYRLPALTVGNYFTGPGGTGTPLSAGQDILVSQTIYVFAQTGGSPNCTAEEEIQILVNPVPPGPVSACDTYTLPALTIGEYRTAPNGGGTVIPAGRAITTTTTIYYFIPAAATCTNTTSFVVTIYNTPTLDTFNPVYNVCDEFTLTPLTVGNYYTLTGGPTGGGQVIPVGTVLTTSQTVFVYAATGGAGECFRETSFVVNITATPAIVAQSDAPVCDFYNLPNLPAGYGYYRLSGGPTTPGQTQLPNQFRITTNDDPDDGTRVYIYAAAAGNPSCFMETYFNVIIFSASVDTEVTTIANGSTAPGSAYWAAASLETDTTSPLAGQLVLDVEACDTYTLPNINVGGTNPNDTYLQHYYTLQGGPDVAGQQMITNLTFTASARVYLYRRLTGRQNCSDEASIDIVINQTPVVDKTQTNFSDCDTHTLPALTVGNYFSSPNGVNPITNLTITATQTIYVYAQTGTNRICSDQHSFVLTINRIDVPVPANVVSCDQYVLVTPNPATARYFDLAGGPGVPGQVERFVGDTLLPGDYDLWVWDETHTTPNCTDEETFHIKVVARPVGILPTGLVTCAIDDIGHGIFDLTPAIAEAIGTQPLVAATIHLTLPDAERGTNIWTNITAFANGNANTQTVYIRLYSTLSTDCYTVVPLQLTTNPRPIAVDPLVPYAICDNGASDTDGIGVFNLTTYEARVLGALNPTLHTVTYYETIAAANAGTPAIANPTNYNSVTTTVYLKVTINATGCYDIVPLNLVVNPLPVVTNPTPLVLCDEDNPGDEVEEFDLTGKTDEITGGVNGLTTTFHTNLADAEAGTGAIPNPETYENTGSPAVQPIFVRITDNVTGCYRIVLLDIRVEPLPILVQPTTDELTVCSTTNNNLGNFDLDQIAAEMIDGGTNMTVAFYYTMTDAERGNNAITGTANFENTDNTTLYVVATNTLTGCRSIVYTITLIVNPAPADVQLTDLRDCDDNDAINDGRVVFDLTQQDAAIYTLTQQVPGSLVIRYFIDEPSATAGFPRITSPATFVGIDNQEVWVRIEYPATECFIVTSFKLFVDRPQELAHATPLIVCDELPNDNKALFDLTSKDDEILTPTGIGEQNLVQYFILEADRDAAINWITTPEAFENTVAGYQTLYVLVTTPQGCISKETLTLIVNPSPNPNINPLVLEKCDSHDATIGDGIEEFDLTDAAVNILAGDTQSVLTYYANAADEAAGIAIPDETKYLNVTPWDDTVIVRVTRTDTQPGSPACSVLVTLPLHVNPLPPVYDSTGVVPLYAICNDPTTGFETFNLIGHVTDLITAAGEVPTNFDIRFYASLADITAGTALPHNYTNVTAGHQQIWVVVTNRTTTCSITTTLDLYAEQAAVANPVTSPANSPMVECDYDGANDGFTAFDLTPAGAEVLGSQNPAQYTLGYYTSQAAAEAGDITAAEYIATPAAFTNTVYLGQTIWVRVTNTSTFSPCYAVTSFNIRVSLLPTPNITSEDNDDTLCVEYSSGNVNKPVYLHAGDTTAGNTYQWYLNGTAVATNGTSERYTATEEGLYTVEVWNADNCISDAVAPFEVFLSGPAEIINTGYVVSNAFGDNQTVTVLVQGYGDYQYSLAPEDADGNATPLGPWQNSNVFTNVPLGFFTVYVRDANTLEINPCDMLRIPGVSVVDYPKYFTPNGDGINDYWNIIGLQGTGARIFIFDRYGKLIKQLSPDSRTDKGQGWDGTYNGNPLPSDDYWFTVEFNENGHARTFKAHFAMKR